MSAKKTSKDTVEKNKPSPETMEAMDDNVERSDFFIVGMGGSAGGFEAYEEFFKSLPSDTGMSFVLVSHLDPAKRDIMPDLIQRYTKMSVVQAEDGMTVKPDHVYIIPPNKDLSISGGVLKLDVMSSKRGIRMPIDVFLRSLAQDMHEMAIAIIFSGMGSDGMLGVKAIKEKNGTVMVQDPTEAKFDSMPQNAVNTGMVDYVAPAYDLPALLVDFEKSYNRLLSRGPIEKKKGASEIEKILSIVLRKTGHDFTEYKPSTIFRRIERRMTVHQLKAMSEYVDYLNGHPEEIDLLFKELLIGVTNFFRDSEAFDALENEAIPELLKNINPNALIRIWVPGCSTGEEAYSIAILFLESLGERMNKVQIFATDIDPDAIEFARKGLYPDNIATDVSEERLRKYFTREQNFYKVKKHVREMIIFAEQDVAHDPPFSGMDLISCRNLLIYLTREMQNRIISLFAYSMNPGGLLFLGTSETLGRMSDLFTTINNKWKIYKRKEYTTRREVQTIIPVSTSNPMERMRIQSMGIRPAISELAHTVLLDEYTPPAVIVDQNGEVVYIHGHTGKYLEPAPGKAGMNLIAMARKGLSTELGIAFEKVKRDNIDILLKSVEVQTNGHVQPVDVTVKPIRQPEAMKNFILVSFRDVLKTPVKKEGAVTESKGEKYREVIEELKYTKEKLQNTMEEMHASQEEMRSMNEELQSTNEELQSTNEELTTSKEELQSLNEELVTVNSELQSKVDDLTRVNNDIKNLLNSTDIATIFLDGDLKITRFTPAVTKIVNLLPTDMGRPFSDISTKIKGQPEAGDGMIVKESQRVIETLAIVEKQIETRDNRWFTMRILPYRTVDNVIDGVVVTFSDITDLKQFEESIKESKEYSEAIVATVREPLIILDDSLHVVTANKAFYSMFNVIPRDVEGRLLFDIDSGQWDIPALKKQLSEVLAKKKAFEDYRIERNFRGAGRRGIILNARKLELGGKKGLILMAVQDDRAAG